MSNLVEGILNVSLNKTEHAVQSYVARKGAKNITAINVISTHINNK